jgi:Uma2 family endonuclease
MTVMNSHGLSTIDDLLNTPEDGQKYELVDGEIIVSPGGMRHSEIGIQIAYLLKTYIDDSPIGRLLGSDVGIILPNGNLRSPDVSFVSFEKLPKGNTPITFWKFIPDLVVEILSPDDSMRQVADKIAEFLEAGVPLIWLVDPENQTVTVYRSLTDTTKLTASDTINADLILPGFSSKVSNFFS